MLMGKFFNQLTKKGKIPIKFWHLHGTKIKFANSAEWERQHDATSATIRRTTFALVIFCLFCFLTLGEPDIKLLDANATVTVPFAEVPISFVFFLIVGPFIIIALSIYLHIFYSYLNFLNSCKIEESKALPYIFNINNFFPKVISKILIYWLAPATLLFFTWKSLPRPEGKILLFLTSIFTLSQIFFKIRQHQYEKKSSFLQRLDWLLLSAICLYSISIFIFPEVVPNRKMDLSEKDLSNMDLRYINLQEANLEKSNLSKSNLEGANLSGAYLRGVDFTEASLIGANLSNADISEANFSKASLSMANFSKSNLPKVVLVDFDLKATNFSEATLTGADFKGAILNTANLSKANLSEAILKNAILKLSDLSGADLSRADLSNAELDKAQLNNANLTAAIFSYAQLPEANLKNSTLNDANLTGAYLAEADLSLASLKDANLDDAVLHDANLNRTDLTKASLNNADLSEAKLIDVIGLKQKQLTKACYYKEFKAPKFSNEENFELPPICRNTE